MPDSNQDRTEAPTPRRRLEARQDGLVAKSNDLIGAVVLMGAMICLYVFGQRILEGLLTVTRGCLSGSLGVELDPGRTVPLLAATFNETVAVVLPVMLVVLVSALAGSFIQVGALFTTKPIKPSPHRLNPILGLKRMFGPQAFVHLLMSLAKIILLSLVAWLTLRSRIHLLAQAPAMHLPAILAAIAEFVFVLGIRLAMVLLFLGVIDYLYQRYRREQDLKMTRDQLRDEMKRMEGDPNLKQNRREVRRQLTVNRVGETVPHADVIVVDSAELAVAVNYIPEKMKAPKVTAKGTGVLARRIRELAVQNNIPIVERAALVRGLYKNVGVGCEVSPELYKELAEILAYVYSVSSAGLVRPLFAGVN